MNPAGSELTNAMDIKKLHELLGRIQAIGVSHDQPSVYVQIGIKPDDMEIYASPITHPISTTEEKAEPEECCLLTHSQSRSQLASLYSPALSAWRWCCPAWAGLFHSNH